MPLIKPKSKLKNILFESKFIFVLFDLIYIWSNKIWNWYKGLFGIEYVDVNWLKEKLEGIK